MREALVNIMMVIILQYRSVLNQYVIYPLNLPNFVSNLSLNKSENNKVWSKRESCQNHQKT